MRCLTAYLLCSPLQAVLHPQAPLMDIAQGRLQPLCIKALKRVFIMSDKNQVPQLVILWAVRRYQASTPSAAMHSLLLCMSSKVPSHAFKRLLHLSWPRCLPPCCSV